MTRFTLQATHGEHSHVAKLTDEIVLALRREQPTRLAEWLAERDIKVSLATARRAKNFQTWTHLPASGVR